jgi:hypothetical protein
LQNRQFILVLLQYFLCQEQAGTFSAYFAPAAFRENKVGGDVIEIVDYKVLPGPIDKFNIIRQETSGQSGNQPMFQGRITHKIIRSGIAIAVIN